MKLTFFILAGCWLIAWPVALPAATPIESILAPVVAAQPTPEVSRRPALVGTFLLDESVLFARVAQQLAKRLQLSDGELSLSPASPWQPVVLPAGAVWDVTLLDAPESKTLTSLFYIRFRLEAEHAVVAEWQIPVHAQLNAEVWVATRRLTRGEVADPSANLEKRCVNVLGQHEAPLSSRTPVDGLEVAEAIAAGEALTWRDLVPRNLVRRGQLIDVVAADGPFSVAMKGLAMQDGANGSTVRVRNLASQREITAQVVGENKVSVKF